MSERHPKGIWYLIGLYMWEYFSFYGMRAILILYLTQQLALSDDASYSIYGVYTSLVYFTPLIGGIIADKVFGFKNSVMLGAILMVVGHLILGLSGDNGLFLAMAFIICGYGFFKSNMSCLVAHIYGPDHPKRDSGFILMYVGGNIGSLLAPIVCGLVAVKWGYHVAFTLAGIGMSIGLVIFILGKKYVPNDLQNVVGSKLKSKNTFAIVIGAAIVVIIGAYYVISNSWSGYLIVFAVIFSAVFLLRYAIKGSKKERKQLAISALFMFFGMLYWIFNGQNGSSITLFISRDINTTLMGLHWPASIFLSIDPIAVLSGGVLTVYLFSKLKGKSSRVMDMVKFSLGLILLTLSFMLLFIGAKISATSGSNASAIWPILALFMLGLSELFIDPIAMAQVTKMNTGYVGTLAAIYMLITGSVANFLAAKLAAVYAGGAVGISHVGQAQLYESLFWQIFVMAGVVIVCWYFVVHFIKRSDHNKEVVVA
jgi:POT family proton-dependent oligopeptide transporter